MSTWSEQHGVEVDESEIDPDELFDARRLGWAKWDPADYDFVDLDEPDDEHPRTD